MERQYLSVQGLHQNGCQDSDESSVLTRTRVVVAPRYVILCQDSRMKRWKGERRVGSAEIWGTFFSPITPLEKSGSISTAYTHYRSRVPGCLACPSNEQHDSWISGTKGNNRGPVGTRSQFATWGLF